MEIKINKPMKYADSLLFEKETGFNYFQRDEDFYLSGDATDKELLAAFDKHNPIKPIAATPKEALLAKLGITQDEARLLLS